MNSFKALNDELKRVFKDRQTIADKCKQKKMERSEMSRKETFEAEVNKIKALVYKQLETEEKKNHPTVKFTMMTVMSLVQQRRKKL
jgi:hypothetical protein